MKTSLTVFFEEPIWVGVFERIDEGKLSVCKVTFGAEPKDYDVWEFVLQHYNELVFSPAVETEARQIADNPKRRLRNARKQTERIGIGTKSRQALQLQREEMKTERRQLSREQRDEEAQRRNEADEEKRKEAWTLMQGNTARQSKLKAAVGICMLAAMLFLLAGCGAGSAFDGSRVSDASGFRMEYSILNQEESAELNLTKGDCLQVSLSHTEGYVDVTVQPEGKEPIYRGNGQQTADFVLEIVETGNYHLSVSGHQAKGKITFTRIPGEQE